MKIVIAPDSFKGSLTALEVANAVARGVKNADKQIETLVAPMADGGEGTVQAMVDATKGRMIEPTVSDPLGRSIKSFYGILGDGETAVIEMAAASGLPLLKEDEKDPMVTTTFGTGELIKDALERGCRKFIIGVGGSATNDGGAGMAQALGVQFVDKQGESIGSGGGVLSKIETIDTSGLDERIEDSVFTIACDVDNPLCGEHGASHVFGRQKGASEKEVEILDKQLLHYAEKIKAQLKVDVKDMPGAGAAGGLAAGMKVFLNGNLKKGIDIITEVSKLSEKMENADLVITGEGQMDGQTAFGKTPFGVAQIAKQKGIPVVGIAGGLGKDYESLFQKGFDGIYSITDRPMTLDEAMKNSEKLVEKLAESITRFWLATKNTNKQ